MSFGNSKKYWKVEQYTEIKWERPKYKSLNIMCKNTKLPMLNRYGKFGVCFMYISSSNLSPEAFEPKHRKSKIQTEHKKHLNPNKAKW